MNKELLISNLRFRVNVVFGLYHVISRGDGIPDIACFKQKVACPLFYPSVLYGAPYGHGYE